MLANYNYSRLKGTFISNNNKDFIHKYIANANKQYMDALVRERQNKLDKIKNKCKLIYYPGNELKSNYNKCITVVFAWLDSLSKFCSNYLFHRN
jgi:hypothetical protein